MDELREKLAHLEERRDELQGALREAEARQNAFHQPQKDLMAFHFVLHQMDRMKLKQASPQDRRRVYEALRLQVTVDGEYQTRLNGIFDPDVYLPSVLRDPPADPTMPRLRVPKETKVHIITPCVKCVAASDARRSSG
jgi:hypothetical protein